MPTELTPARITITAAIYERTYARGPRGRGSWAFCPASKANDNDYLTWTLFSPSMTYGEARRWIREAVAAQRAASAAPEWQATEWAVLP